MPTLSANLSAEIRLQQIFERVRSFVSQRHPRLAKVDLEPDCPQIRQRRRRSSHVEHRRSFMHVGHYDGVVCATPMAAKLTDSYLVGIFIHEFSHIASDGGEGEADMWSLAQFGIPIIYKGPLFLEWIDPKIIREKGI